MPAKPEFLTWEKPGQDDAELRDHLVRALIRSGVCVTLQGPDLAYLFIANLPDCWNVAPGGDPTDEEIFGTETGTELMRLKAAAVAAGEKQRAEFAIGEDVFFEVHAEPISIRGRVSVMTTIIDLTEERRRERVLRALIREVSHRSKNLLAIIQSIATQTARYAPDLNSFLTKFYGRLYSLSGAQDLITDSSWRGARFRDLAEHQIEKYLPEVPGTVVITGEDAWLNPNEAIHVGLALHELVVNAAGAGTMRAEGPPIEISCTILNEGRDKSGDEARIQIAWTEKRPCDAAGAGDPSSGFGSVVLERVVPNAVSGRAEYHIEDRDVRYRLTFQQHNEE